MVGILGVVLTICIFYYLRLMRQAYLEVALVYLYTIGLVVLKPNGSLEILPDGIDDTASSIRPSTLDSAKSKAKSYKVILTFERCKFLYC